MLRPTLAVFLGLSLFGSTAQAQALAGVTGSATGTAAGGANGANLNGVPTTATGFVEMIQEAQQTGGQVSGFSQSSYYANSGYTGYGNFYGGYSPAFAVGATGMGLPGLNANPLGYGGLNGPYFAGSGLGVGYGTNALSPLLLGRTIGQSSYYGGGNGMLNSVPYGVSNLYQLMPNQQIPNLNVNGGMAQLLGPKTKPGVGVAGAARGNSEASAILNGEVPSRQNARATAKSKAAARRSAAAAKRGR